MRDSITNPIVVVAPAPSIENRYLQAYLVENIADFKTREEYCHYITHKINNVVHKDGRIYLRIDNNKNLIAASVSPYSTTFTDNIEEKIKPLVLAFKKKRYLTYSSCMGHGQDFRRFVGLAFCDEESRQYVADQIMGLKIPGVKVNFRNTVTNSKVTQNSRTKLPEFGVYSNKEKEEREANPDLELETFCFNIQFHRQYSEYFFLEIVILEAISYNYEGIPKEILKIFQRLYKTLFWDYLTNKVVALIESDSFKRYSY